MTAVRAVLRRVAAELSRTGRPFALVGGLAVSVRTEPRFTRDVDLAVAVAGDAEAEALIHRLRTAGYRIDTVVEQQAAGRMATVRLRLAREPHGTVVDLLFASSGIEPEVVAEAEMLELAARGHPDVEIAVDLDGEGGVSWRYEIAFHQDNRRRPRIRRERVSRSGEALVDRPNEEDAADPQRLTQTYLEQVSVNQPFRDLAAFFGSIRYLHLVPQLVREPDRSAPSTVLRQLRTGSA